MRDKLPRTENTESLDITFCAVSETLAWGIPLCDARLKTLAL